MRNITNETYLNQAPQRQRSPRIEDLARLRVAKARARVASAIGVESIDAATLHIIRIACKRLRYDLEFFRELDDTLGGTEAIKQLKNLQDVLGANHDAHVQKLRFAEMKSRSGIEDTVIEAIEKLERSLDRLEEKFKVESLACLTRALRFLS